VPVPRIAVVPGDGIGREVVPVAVDLLRLVAERRSTEIDFVEMPWGADHFLATGESLPENAIEELSSSYDAILLGALGDPRIPSNRHAREILLGLRFELDLYINLRPIRLIDERLTPLKGVGPEDVDMVVFRENTEGAYVGIGGVFRKGTAAEVAIQEDVTTRAGVERICRAAFEYARRRALERVTMADKANAMEFVGGVWRQVFAEVAADYAELEAETVYVDALAMDLVRRPHHYQVIVTNNLFGDILSDLAAQLAGGLGIAPSANLHPGRTSLFEPVHGSAPDLVGKGQANPVATILSAALLLDQLGEAGAARILERAVFAAVRAGETTPDLGGTLTTAQVGAAVGRRLEALSDAESS
jgi:3-isopropylmalate dehydrogenase